MTEGWVHDFQAVCPQGHNRNFVWDSDTEDKLNVVNARCVYCGRERAFTVVQYWQEPCLESQWKGVK